jgi:hypothetical protein
MTQDEKYRRYAHEAQEQAQLKRSRGERRWLTNGMVDAGKVGPVRLARREMPARKESLSRRLHKLRRMRAVLDVQR